MRLKPLLRFEALNLNVIIECLAKCPKTTRKHDKKESKSMFNNV